MVGDCPRCLTRVLMAIGEPCPSCGGIVTRELLDAFAGFAAVSVDEGSPVPAYCFLCDAPRELLFKIRVDPKDGSVRVEDAQSRREKLGFAARSFLVFLKAFLWAVLFQRFHPTASFDEDPGIRVYIPSCRKCQGSVHIGRISGYERSVTILAGESFRQRLEEAASRRGKL